MEECLSDPECYAVNEKNTGDQGVPLEGEEEEEEIFEKPFDMLKMDLLPTPRGSKFHQNLACKRQLLPASVLRDVVWSTMNAAIATSRSRAREDCFPFAETKSRDAWFQFLRCEQNTKAYVYGFDVWLVYTFLCARNETHEILKCGVVPCLDLDDLDVLKDAYNGLYGKPKTQAEEMCIYARLSSSEITSDIRHVFTELAAAFDFTCRGIRIFQTRVDSRETRCYRDSFMIEMSTLLHHFKFVANVYEDYARRKVEGERRPLQTHFSP